MGCSPAPLEKVTGAEGLCEEHSPQSIFLSSSCLTIYIFGETELLGFFRPSASQHRNKNHVLCVGKPLVTLTGWGCQHLCSVLWKLGVSSWKRSGYLRGTALQEGEKTKTENPIRNIAELKDLYWNSVMEKVVSLWEIRLLINEGYLSGSVENWKVVLQILLYLLPG